MSSGNKPLSEPNAVPDLYHHKGVTSPQCVNIIHEYQFPSTWYLFCQFFIRQSSLPSSTLAKEIESIQNDIGNLCSEPQKTEEVASINLCLGICEVSCGIPNQLIVLEVLKPNKIIKVSGKLNFLYIHGHLVVKSTENKNTWSMWQNFPTWSYLQEPKMKERWRVNMKFFMLYVFIFMGFSYVYLPVNWQYLIFFSFSPTDSCLFMMTSSNGNICRVTGHLCGEFTGPRWIPRTKVSDA